VPGAQIIPDSVLTVFLNFTEIGNIMFGSDAEYRQTLAV